LWFLRRSPPSMLIPRLRQLFALATSLQESGFAVDGSRQDTREILRLRRSYRYAKFGAVKIVGMREIDAHSAFDAALVPKYAPDVTPMHRFDAHNQSSIRDEEWPRPGIPECDERRHAKDVDP